MLNYWDKYPIVRLLLFTITGIVIAVAFQLESKTTFTLIISLLLIIFLIIEKVNNSIPALLKSLLLNFTFVMLGISLVANNWDFNHPNHLSKINADYVIAKLNSEPNYQNGYYLIEAKAQQAYLSEKLIDVSGNLYLKIFHNHESELLRQSDLVLLNNQFSSQADSLNSFYLQSKNIFLSAKFEPNQWAIYQKGKPSFIVNAQNSINENLKKYIGNHEAYGVAKALILGNKNQVNYKTYRVFADAGAMHILAVSGLHVGIVAGLITFLLSKISFFENKRLAKICITISCLLLYAALTGFSPSVNRAVIMFSFGVIGYHFKRDVNIYNIIAASAFLLLVINPLWLLNIGFQLSYTAVLGIIYFYNKIYKTIKLKNKMLNWLWQATSISIAAQIATLPLVLYHFNQFPLLSILANPIAIICALMVVTLGLFFIILSFANQLFNLDFLLSTIANFIQWIILSSSHFFEWIQSIPFSVIKVEHFNIYWLFTTYLLLVLAIIFYENVKSKQKFVSV